MNLPAPKYIAQLNVSDAINSDIIKVLLKDVKEAISQTKSFSKRFESDTKLQEAAKVWKFFKEHITYKRDTDNKQLVRLPSRFIAGEAEGDCKSFSLSIVSILYNLGFKNVRFRFANYKTGTTPTHVYAVAEDENGKDIIVDAVYTHFNKEKKPNYKFDKKIMEVYTLAGIGGKKKRKRGGGFLRRLGKGLKKINVAKGLKKFGLALPRRAFRTLVAINAHGFASKLARAYKKNPDKVAKFWKSLGGNTNDLIKSVNKGAKKKSILGIGGIEALPPQWQNIYRLRRLIMQARARRNRQAYRSYLRLYRKAINDLRHSNAARHRRRGRIYKNGTVRGIEGVEGIGALPALIASATPVIVAAVKLLKGLGIGEKKDKDGNPTESTTEQILTKTAESVQATGGNPSSAMVDPTDPENADKVDTQEKESDDPDGGFSASPLLIGGIGVGAFLLFGLGKK